MHIANTHETAPITGASSTKIWERSGGGLDHVPAQMVMVMEVQAMVDAALCGFDLGETVTLPS